MSLYFLSRAIMLFMAIMNAADATRTLDWIKACGGLCAAFVFAGFAREGHQRRPKTGPSPAKI
jgi:hypothetical protein